jgi:esterase/lipase superfamily enzyme
MGVIRRRATRCVFWCWCIWSLKNLSDEGQPRNSRKDFIQDLVEALPPGAVLHIVAHSMGNRAVLWALTRLSLPQERLGQLIMIAPDVDAEIFEDLVARFGPFLRKSLYVSKHDLALQAAGWLRAGTPRAGDAKKQYVVIKEMDTIDASPLKAGMIGHSVYDYSQVLFGDLGAVLKNQPISSRSLTACTVKSIASCSAGHGMQLPCVVSACPVIERRSPFPKMLLTGRSLSSII